MFAWDVCLQSNDVYLGWYSCVVAIRFVCPNGTLENADREQCLRVIPVEEQTVNRSQLADPSAAYAQQYVNRIGFTSMD